MLLNNKKLIHSHQSKLRERLRRSYTPESHPSLDLIPDSRPHLDETEQNIIEILDTQPKKHPQLRVQKKKEIATQTSQYLTQP